MFEEEYNNLSNSDKENFKRVANLILSKTFIVNHIYDRNQKTFKSNPDYRFLDRNIDIFANYLELAGYKMIKDSNYEVIYIENEYGFNKKRLDKSTTLFLYGLRLKYDEEREKIRLNSEVIITVSEIIATLKDVGAYDKKPSDVEIRTALSTLISFNIIQKIDGILEKPDTKIVILPSILFAITNEKITSLSNTINELNKSQEENFEEDLEEENVGVEEE